MKPKKIFIEEMKQRTFQFAIDVIKFCDSLKQSMASSVITGQLIKSSTSTGANYRAACQSRSNKEFFSKMCIVVEEIDESEYWLLVIEAADLTTDKPALSSLIKEANEMLKIMTKSKSTAYRKLNPRH